MKPGDLRIITANKLYATTGLQWFAPAQDGVTLWVNAGQLVVLLWTETHYSNDTLPESRIVWFVLTQRGLAMTTESSLRVNTVSLEGETL
jgi:hypothetical protein